MVQSTVFLNNRTQSVRLPKAVAFDDAVTSVDVAVVGNSRVLTPVGLRWDEWFAHGLKPTDDFLADRDQPIAEERT